MKHLSIKILTIFIFIHCNVYGVKSYFFQQLDITHGLSQSKVNCIHYDCKGYLWIGTPYGLNRYDRDGLKQYFHLEKADSPLPDNEILFIQEDKEKNLWIGTSRGLCKYNTSSSKFEKVQYKGNQLTANSALQINDGLYFGGSEEIFSYNYQTQEIVKLPLLTAKRKYTNFTQMYQYDKENIIINTNLYGVFNYNFTSHQLTELSFIPKGNKLSIFVDSHKRLWVSKYGDGVYCYQNNQLIKHFTTYNSSLSYNVILTMEEKDGYLWLGTDGGGIQFISLDDLTLKNIPNTTDEDPFYSVNAVNCLYKDPMNNMWAGTIRSGVIYIYEVDAKSYKKVPMNNPCGLSNQTVNCIYEDAEGFIWLGTDGGGLNRYDTQTRRFRHYPSTQNEKITSIISYNASELLVFYFNKGIFIINKKTGYVRPFTAFYQEKENQSLHNGISTFILDVTDNKILFSDVNLSVYDKSTQQYTVIGRRGIDFERFSPLLRKSGDGEVYIVDHYQILKYDEKAQKLSIYYKGKDAIHDMCIDTHKNLWLATQNGLYRYSKRANRIDKIRPDLLKSINSVVADKNDYLWIGTSSNRLFLYDVTADLLSLLGESDGFIINEYLFGSMFVSSQGEAFIGGTMGLSIADKQITEKQMAHAEKKENAIELIDLFVNGKSYKKTNWEKGETITLPWNFYSLQLKCMIKEDNIFRKHAFKYKIKNNHNEEEIQSFSHSLTIHALRDGKHTIAVSYTTKEGDWSDPIVLAHVEVIPPWWKSTYFYLAILLLIIAVIVLIVFSFIIHEKKMRKREINQLNNRVTQERIRFLVNIGHELRTPLTLISAPLKQIIEHDLESSYLSQKLENIYKQSMKIKEMVDMVLDAKKLKDGEEALHLVSYPLNTWVKETAAQFEDELSSHSMRIQYKLDENIQSVPLDKEKCALVLNNFLMNAIKFSEGYTTITVYTQKTGSNMVRVSVTDEGVGLKDEAIPQLFSLYYQGQEKKSGSSIGLSYCKILIDLHNGRIGAYRNKDKGSTFYFELPLSTENVTTFEAEIAVECPVIKDEYEILKSYSVLVIVEKVDLRFYLKDALKSYFEHVYIAKNGLEGLEYIQRYSPDIVVSDAIMSKMNGFIVCKKIKGEPSTSHIPVILLTAYYNPTNMLTGYRMGADAFISKPFEIDTLLSIINNLLSLRKAIKQRYLGAEPAQSMQKDLMINNADEEFIEKLNSIIEENILNVDLNVEFLTKAMGIGRTALFNKVKNVTNLGIIDYINGIRIKKAMEFLKNTNLSVAEISEKVGFSYPQYFGKVFKKQTSMSPSEYRNQFNSSLHV